MSLSILLIDDEAGIRSLLREVLEEQGHKVWEAKDGIVGLEQFHSIQPDLVLVDILMPGLNGLSVLQEIRRQNLIVGVIMASALSSKQAIMTAMDSGADGYIFKPFKFQELFKELERVAEHVRTRRYPTSVNHYQHESSTSVPHQKLERAAPE